MTEASALDIEADVAAAVDLLSQARDAVDDALDARDAAVRAALAQGSRYARLSELTGLSRNQLDAIRRGERSGRR